MFISFANLTQDENFYINTFFLWESYENLTFYDIGRVKIQGRKQTVGKKTKKIPVVPKNFYYCGVQTTPYYTT